MAQPESLTCTVTAIGCAGSHQAPLAKYASLLMSRCIITKANSVSMLSRTVHGFVGQEALFSSGTALKIYASLLMSGQSNLDKNHIVDKAAPDPWQH